MDYRVNCGKWQLTTACNSNQGLVKWHACRKQTEIKITQGLRQNENNRSWQLDRQQISFTQTFPLCKHDQSYYEGFHGHDMRLQNNSQKMSIKQKWVTVSNDYNGDLQSRSMYYSPNSWAGLSEAAFTCTKLLLNVQCALTDMDCLLWKGKNHPQLALTVCLLQPTDFLD